MNDLLIYIGLILFLLVLYVLSMIRHWPRKRLTEDQVELINRYGLMHMTYQTKIPSIMEKGLVPSPEKKMYNVEKNMVWTYIADPKTFQEKISIVHSKGKRKDYDCIIIFKNIEDYNNLRYRKYDEAVVHIGPLKTSDMEYFTLEEAMASTEFL